MSTRSVKLRMKNEAPTLCDTMFLLKNLFLPKRKVSSCRKLYHLDVQSATMFTHFIAMAKTKMVIKNINAVNVITSLSLTDRQGQELFVITHDVLFVVMPLFRTTIKSYILSTSVVTRSATIHFLSKSLLLFRRLLSLTY